MIVKVENLSKSFKHNIIFENVNIIFEPGHIYGFIGRNGTGKTVFLKTLCGILNADTGRILFDDEETLRTTGVPKSTRALIENPEMINELTGFENLKLIASIQNTINDDRIKEVLKLVGLDNEYNKKFKNYSLGMKQKLGIAQEMKEDADFRIFDEPFNGLDNKSCDDMRKLFKQLKKQGKILIVATHVKEDIDNLIDVLYRIDNGSLIHEK